MADTKQQWYKDAKYGLFIHWGLYSILAGEWKDPKTGEVTKTDRIAEWIENNLNIDKEDYRKLKDEFHPDKFDADMFVKRAKEQWGVKYIVLTSKHHEGFAMYDSKVSDFNVVKAAGRDILRELSDACKKYDMTMGIYYSQAQDWDDDNAYKKDYEDKNEWKPEFRTYFDEKCKPQLKELLENYDNISLIWFDTPMGMTADEAQELRDWVKGIKPDCIISGRIGHQKGDYMTTGDNFIPRLPYDGDWEVPATVNDTWGYNKYDTNWKNPDDILNLLLKIVGRGGNYLLNVGPMADGTVPEACVEVMNEVGKYVTENAEAIYGTKNVGIYPYEIPSIEFTKRPHKLYVHVLAPRYRVELLNIGNQLKGAYVVSTGEKLPCRACFTMNNNWGYCANDHYYKPASMLIKKLVECVSKGGNMILNVGPDAKGKFPKESSAILAEIGRWMDKNHDSIYGCVPAENIPKPDYGRITRNGNKYYVHIYENTLGPLPLLGFDKDKIVKVRALDDGHEVPISNAWMHSDYPDIAFVDLGPDPVLPDPVDYVLEVEMAE